VAMFLYQEKWYSFATYFEPIKKIKISF